MIDAHAHLTDERFQDDVEEVVARAEAAGVDTIVSIATDPGDARAAIALAGRFPGVYATAGVHPNAADSTPPQALDEVRALASHPRVVAIGETGLDYHYDTPREPQLAFFREQIGIALELDLPLVVHARSADDDVAALIREAGPASRGVLHCFVGSRTLLETALEHGWYVSFAGMVTFRKWEGADLLRAVPLDRILIETDSPYLAPVPRRGRRNEPAFVVHTLEAVATLRGEEPAQLAEATTANARALYRLPPAPPAAAPGRP